MLGQAEEVEGGLWVVALRLQDGQELWRSDPVAMDLTSQALYGLVQGRALYEFYQQLGSDQIAVLKRGLDDGKTHWLTHVHSGRLVSARVTGRGLEVAVFLGGGVNSPLAQFVNGWPRSIANVPEERADSGSSSR